jgi:hypothetical protein
LLRDSGGRKQTDEKLTKLATDINTKANEEGSEEQRDHRREGQARRLVNATTAIHFRQNTTSQ